MMLLKKIIKSFLSKYASKSNYKFILKDWIGLFDLSLSSQVLETKRFTKNLQTINLKYPNSKNLLVIAPHPDDDIFGAGGTILKSIKKGAKVNVLYVTNGSKNASRIELIKKESVKVCNNIGASYDFLNCEVGNIPTTDNELNEKILSIINNNNIGTIFTSFLFDDEDDHKRVNHLLYKILRNYKKNLELWSYQIYSSIIPNVIVDITEIMEKKEKLMLEFKSVKGNRNWPHYIKGLNATNCRYINNKNKTYGEVFFVLPLGEYIDICQKYFSNDLEKIYYTDNYKNNY